jgi:hypothetical protein
MEYSLTIFKNAFDNRTHRRMDFQSWEDFVGLLRDLSKQPLKDKKSAQLISPAIYEAGTTRSNRNVTEWGKWAAVDVDDYTGNIDDILTRFESLNTCIYSTASSTVSQAKFRIVFDLDRRVDTEELRHFWFALNKHIGELGDAQTKDSSRMYYIPGSYEGSNNFFHTTSGSPLVVDGLLRAHPYVVPTGNNFLDKLPEEMKDRIIEHRKGSLDQTDVTWTGYLDCPFVPNRMVMEYKSISGEGWYRYLFKIMTAIACNAVKNKYPITAKEIAMLCREIDAETGGWYDNRPLEREATSAIQFAYANAWDGE